jgi:hypothetical protein
LGSPFSLLWTLAYVARSNKNNTFYVRIRISCLVREPARVGWVAGGNSFCSMPVLFFSFFLPFPFCL